MQAVVPRFAPASLAGLCLAWAACGAPQPPRCPEPPSTSAHYVDADNNSLEQYDAVWNALARFYHSTQPATIHVRYRPSGTSMFDVPSSGVVISLSSIYGSSPRPTIAHESSHLFLAELTAGASTLDAFRFIDEGLASILEHETEGQVAEYKARALQRAAGRLREAPITFERIQRWSTYFGSGEKGMDFGAYDVGASFVFFVRDELGDPALLDLLRAVGATRSLDASVRQALGRSLPEVEMAWLAYVRRTPVDVPKIVESTPANGSRAVPTTLTEIAVTFDVEMTPNICVLTPCKEGICFDHARWPTPRTLTIAIDRALLPAHAYQLSLGTSSCRLQSRTGAELPVTEWRFETR